MDSDQAKLFIGGISWETTEDLLRDHFSRYGDVIRTAVIRDKVTDRPRGFGFVVFSDPAVLDTVVHEQHTIAGRLVEVKKALSREEHQMNSRVIHTNSGKSYPGVAASTRTKKIFVGGLPSTISEDEFRQYFETYGPVTNVVLMYDRDTQRSRGFGFISFDTEEAVDRVLHKTFHDLNGKKVEVKRALPKDSHPYGGNRNSDGGGSYRASGGNGGAGRLNSNRYSQQNPSSGGFQSYGNSSAYGESGYRYRPPNNGMGYGGTGGGYGVGNADYGSHVGVVDNGSPYFHTSAYAGGPQGIDNGSSWSSQPPSGHGSGVYGSSTWGSVPNPIETYRSGGYSGSDGSYSSGYGGTGGHYRSATNSTYNSNNYGNVNSESELGSGPWNSHSSQASGNYGSDTGPCGGYSGGYSYGGPTTQESQHQ
ncbi:hypothetical protein MLD38_011945 [Melastoma candidum]|uniref:Uncharacterized protein n=1 Tax=Melastoma candidum TaxID=119954 RepID=A0ACB9RD41_9MYRT|nr:hypothetical protein MLD38_011945 [Melastoma candidum]